MVVVYGNVCVIVGINIMSPVATFSMEVQIVADVCGKK